MEAIILAGGLGTRLRSAIGNEIPKCMAQVAGKPFLWYLLSYLQRLGAERVVLSVGHLRQVIFDWIALHKGEFSFEIAYAVEEEPLGTGGGIKLACSECLSEDVAVLNGDTFFDVDLNDMMRFHKAKGSILTLALKEMTDFDRYGRVIIDPKRHLIKEFKEKAFCPKGLINGGVYILNRHEMIWPAEAKFSFEKAVLEPLAGEGKELGYVCDGYFIDIGIPEDYEKANIDFKHYETL